MSAHARLAPQGAHSPLFTATRGGSPVEMEEVTGPPLKSGTQRVSAPRWWESEELRKPGNLLEHTVGRGLTSLTQQVLGQEMLPAQPLPQRARGPEHLSRRVKRSLGPLLLLHEGLRSTPSSSQALREGTGLRRVTRAGVTLLRLRPPPVDKGRSILLVTLLRTERVSQVVSTGAGRAQLSQNEAPRSALGITTVLGPEVSLHSTSLRLWGVG
ncbi:hypothetical protein CB1_000111008 [Camelus ferus]|nr:hypothetical protein CB1_000111008 [Camelus ferus]